MITHFNVPPISLETDKVEGESEKGKVKKREREKKGKGREWKERETEENERVWKRIDRINAQSRETATPQRRSNPHSSLPLLSLSSLSRCVRMIPTGPLMINQLIDY